MKKLLFISGLLVLSAAVAMGASSSKYYPPSNPWFDGHGGPDAYGYTWVDSDELGGPSVEWIDITGIGVLTTGLGDDNYIGPIDLGFDFNYYWYTIDQVFIGSNGYIKVPPAFNIASPFPASIPLTANPNDYIAIYCGDLWVTANAQVYYWTNSVDSFVVSYINVPCWTTVSPGYTGRHTFQVLFNGTDNTIHFNYGTDQGTFYNNDIIIGIENINGQVGLEHSHDAQVPHSNYTVYFYRPDSTGYEVHDFASNAVLNEPSQAIFLLTDQDYNPVAWVKNAGNQVETGASFELKILDSRNNIMYNQTTPIGALNPGEIYQVNFTTPWRPEVIDQYSVVTVVTLLGDMNPANDSLMAEIEVVEIPGELAYDDGEAETGMAWTGDDGGYGMKFVSPVVPAEITMIRYYISTVNTPPQNFTAKILDDDGPNGYPGTTLFELVQQCNTSNQWYAINCDVTVEDGVFYGVWQQMGNQTIYMGIDQTPPISRQTWELTGGWAPYRTLETEEAMIRVMVGEGAIPQPLIATSDDTLDFGQVLVGDTASINLTIYNIGTSGDLLLESIQIVGVPPNLIYQLFNFTPNTYIAPGDSIIVTVTYHPPVASTFNAQLSITNNSILNPYNVYMTGTGYLSVGDRSGATPVKYELFQNQPNPFNPVTYIDFTLPAAGYVDLKVYNILGKEVARLVEGEMGAGFQRVTFDGGKLGSGIYFYRLNAGNFSAMKKMVLMK